MQKDEANAGRPTSNSKGECQSYSNLGAIQVGRLLAFCDSRNKSWWAVRLYDKIYKFLRMSVLQYRYRRDVLWKKRAPQPAPVKGYSAWLLKISFTTSKN